MGWVSGGNWAEGSLKLGGSGVQGVGGWGAEVERIGWRGGCVEGRRMEGWKVEGWRLEGAGV